MDGSSAPHPSEVWSRTYISYRRLWLDFYLSRFSPEMTGVILDLGGKRINKRGAFAPREAAGSRWWYVNIDPVAGPDFFGDVTAVPCKSGLFDTIICTEVIEHLLEPKKCVCEIYRLLKPGGTLFVSVPFLFPVHADPFDFQRYTEDGLRTLFSSFPIVEVFPMGGYWGTLGMLLEIGAPAMGGPRPVKAIVRRSLTTLARLLCVRDLNLHGRQPQAWRKFTTGYFLKVKK